MTVKFFDFWNIANNNQLQPYCKYINDSLLFDFQNNIRLCPYSDFSFLQKDYNGIWLDVSQVKKAKSDFTEKFFKGETPSLCKDCECYSFEKSNNNQTLKYLYLSNWKNCYINCSYCDYPKEEDLIAAKHYDIYPSIKQLIDSKLIDKNTKVIFECGDATIHPEFDKIMFFFINYEMKNIVVNTPALRYCESISEALSKNILELIVPFDCGCGYIYKQLKGLNKFDIAVNNIKRYLTFQEPGQKRVKLKYTIVQGINDNKKELLDFYIFARDLGIKKLVLDIDIKWYNQIRTTIPYYLKEIVFFAKNISDYNNVQFEFSDRISKIYCSIDKKEFES